MTLDDAIERLIDLRPILGGEAPVAIQMARDAADAPYVLTFTQRTLWVRDALHDVRFELPKWREQSNRGRQRER